MNKQAETDEFELDFSTLLDVPPPAAAAAADNQPVPGRKPQPQLPPPPEGEKYVVFHLDDKLYAVHSGQVAEVIGFLPVAPLPPVVADRAEWLAGIINLRGNITAVVDLRRLWKKQAAASSASAQRRRQEEQHRTKLLVLRSGKDPETAAAASSAVNSHYGNSQPRTAAFFVDRLSEMITLAPKEIEFSAADFASSFPTFFGRVTRKSQTIYLLDAENLFSTLIVNS